MTTQIIPVGAFDFMIFGGTGDLARRKLLPALYYRDVDRQLAPETEIIAVARHVHETYAAEVEAALRQRVAPEHLEQTCIERFLARLSFVALDIMDPDGWLELAARLDDRERIRVFYLATSPGLFGPVCQNLAGQGLITERTRVVLEKPIGRDLASARTINDGIGALLAENQIFRIDHYLGKETVQNLMALRFANSLFEPLWSSAHIDHVQITVAETVGVEDRSDYYDRSGALRDMVQNHLLQLLCLVAMEPPTRFDADAVRDEKLKVLRALKPITGRDVDFKTVRGQYWPGAADGGLAAGYLDEVGTATSRTETFVVVKAEIDGRRWAGVPFYLRTGKRMPIRASEIVIQFRAIPYSIFRRRRPDRCQPAGRPPAAGRGHEALPHGKGPGARRHAPARSAAQPVLRRDLQGALRRRLRAAVDGRGPRQSHALHAPRRGRDRVGLDRADPRRVG